MRIFYHNTANRDKQTVDMPPIRQVQQTFMQAVRKREKPENRELGL